MLNNEDSFNKNLQLTGEINGNIQGITDNLNQYPSINEAINETISNCNDQILKFVENGELPFKILEKLC